MLGVTEMHSREEDRLSALRAMLRGQDGPWDTLELMATATSSSLYLAHPLVLRIRMDHHRSAAELYFDSTKTMSDHI